jgi:hypothetical protein
MAPLNTLNNQMIRRLRNAKPDAEVDQTEPGNPDRLKYRDRMPPMLTIAHREKIG